MHGGGSDWVNAPWDWMVGWILMGLGMLGASGELFGAVEFDGGAWG